MPVYSGRSGKHKTNPKGGKNKLKNNFLAILTFFILTSVIYNHNSYSQKYGEYMYYQNIQSMAEVETKIKSLNNTLERVVQVIEYTNSAAANSKLYAILTSVIFIADTDVVDVKEANAQEFLNMIKNKRAEGYYTYGEPQYSDNMWHQLLVRNK